MNMEVKSGFSRSIKNALETNILWNNTVLGGFLKTNIEFYELREIAEWFKDTMKSMVSPVINLKSYVSSRIESGEINKNNIITILNKADFNIYNINIDTLDIEIPDKKLELFSLLSVNNDFIARFNESLKKRKEIIFQHQLKGEKIYSLSYNEESAGTQRCFQLEGLLDLVIRKGSILPIDELESSLHPDLLKFFI